MLTIWGAGLIFRISKIDNDILEHSENVGCGGGSIIYSKASF